MNDLFLENAAGRLSPFRGMNLEMNTDRGLTGKIPPAIHFFHGETAVESPVSQATTVLHF
jgi:hypothetical protein